VLFRSDDVGFLHALLLRLADQDHIDPHRVFAVGISNGAMMAYGWACARPDDLAGIGVVDGALVSSCSPAPSVQVVAVHGTADRNVPINGGVGPLSVTHYRYPPLTASIAPFVAGDGCGPSPQITHRPMVQISTWTCSGEHNVVVAVVRGMGHIWPGARSLRPTSKQRMVRQTPIALDATTFLWMNLSSPHLEGPPKTRE
jgi:polyhydroxybutyrate depolymerase